MSRGWLEIEVHGEDFFSAFCPDGCQRLLKTEEDDCVSVISFDEPKFSKELIEVIHTSPYAAWDWYKNLFAMHFQLNDLSECFMVEKNES